MTLPKTAKKIVIVLANLMEIDGTLNDESIGRAATGADYFLKHNCDLIITCGWPYRSDSSIFIADALKHYIVNNFQVPASKIYSERRSRDTVGDAVFSKHDINSIPDVEEVVVSTSDYHAARTEQIFNFIFGPKFKVKVIQAPTHYKDEKQQAEDRSLATFKQTFAGIESGHDQQIFERLTSVHPFYNGKVYSKIESLNA